MKNKLLSIAVLVLMGTSLFAQTPYAYYPYYRAGVQTPFAVPTDKVDADLTNTLIGNRASFVMLGPWFDQTNSGSAPSYAADEGVTIIAQETGTTWTPALTDDRIVTETTANLNSAQWNTTEDVFDRRGQTLFYTVNFSTAGDYKIYLRQRNAAGATYIVDVFSKANMDVKIKTFTLNTTGIVSTVDDFSNDNKVQYVTAGGGVSHWVKTVEAITISSPGDYVIKIDAGVGFKWNFGGFTIFPVPAAAVASISLTKPVATGAAVAVNSVATLKASATAASPKTINKVEFFEGANLLGQGTLVGGFYELNWTPTATGSYVISAKLTESDNTVTTTSTTSNIEVVSSLAYVARTAWTDVIQAEDYDFGGSEYGAFYDITSTAASAVSGYRTDGTDIKPGPVGQNVQLGNGGTGWSIGYTSIGEKLNYTIKDVPTGNINVSVNYATPNATAQLKVYLNGTALATMALPSTTDWTIFNNANSEVIAVIGDDDSVDDVLTIEFVGSGSNIDYFSLATATDVPTGLNKLAKSYQCVGTSNAIQLNGLTLGEELTIYNVAGAKVATQKIANSNLTISIQRGIYMVRVADTIAKVIVK